MIQLILTEEQQRILDQSDELVQVVDRTGRLLVSVSIKATEAEIAEAHRVAAELDDLTGTDHELSAAVLDRIAEQSRNFRPAAVSLRELIDRLETQGSVLKN